MTASNGTNCRRRIGLLLLPGFQVMCFSALSVLEVANKKAGKAIYDLHVLSEKGGPVASSFGMAVSTEPMKARDFDTLFDWRRHGNTVGVACNHRIPEGSGQNNETACLDLPWFLCPWRSGPSTETPRHDALAVCR